MRLCERYDPGELARGESFWDELGLSKTQRQKLSNLLRESWARRELERVEKFGARFITAMDLDTPRGSKTSETLPSGFTSRGARTYCFRQSR